jgi:predicted alternative tryptophan synthase beta-subunit
MFTVATLTTTDSDQGSHWKEYETSRFIYGKLERISPVFRTETGAKRWGDKQNVGFKIIKVEVMD